MINSHPEDPQSQRELPSQNLRQRSRARAVRQDELAQEQLFRMTTYGLIGLSAIIFLMLIV